MLKPGSYRDSPEDCQHRGAIIVDWMTPTLGKTGKPPIPGVMWIERCASCNIEVRRVPFPPSEPTLRERLAAWWSRFW